LNANLVRQIVDRLVEADVFGVDGGLDPKVTEYTMNLGLELGTIKKRLTFDEVADTNFVDKVLGEDGRFAR
jgi:hypothetical protein